MMESLLLFLIDHPGANLSYLYDHYKSVLQPIAIDDCIELFQQMNCLETVRVPSKPANEQQLNLYSNEDDDEQDEENQEDRDNDLERLLMKTNYDYRYNTLYCFPTYDCLAKFGLAFPSTLINQSRAMDRMPFPNY